MQIKKQIIFLVIILYSASIYSQIFEKRYDLQASSAFQVRGNVIHTNSNGYVMTCIKRDSTNVNLFRGIGLINTDQNGNIIWTKTYNDSANFSQEPFVCQTSDNGYVISSSTGNPLIGYLIKTDALGNLLWSHKYGPISNSYIYSTGCVSTPTNIFLSGQIGDDFLLIKTDYLGNTIWMKTYDSGLKWD